jgi:hypothetical protein
MICVCGHGKGNHDRGPKGPHRPGDTHCERFACCDRHRRHDGSEHDFISHKVERCPCNEYVENAGSEPDLPVVQVTSAPVEDTVPDPTGTLALCKWLKDRIQVWESEAKAALDMRPGERKLSMIGDRVLGTVTLTKGRRSARVVNEAGLLTFVKEHHPTEIEEAVRSSFRAALLKLALERGALIDRDGVVHDGIVEIVEGDPYPMTKLDANADTTVAGLLATGRITADGIKAINGEKK